MGSLKPVVFGRQRRRSRHGAMVAGVVFFIVFVLLEAPWGMLVTADPVPRGLGVDALAVSFLTLVSVPVAIQAYSNDGILVSWLIAFAATYAVYLSITLTSWGSPPLFGQIIVPLVYALVVASPVGLLGFTIGAGARRVRTARRRG